MKDTVSEGMMTIVVIVIIGLLLVAARTIIWPMIQNKVEDEVNNIGYVEVIDEARF